MNPTDKKNIWQEQLDTLYTHTFKPLTERRNQDKCSVCQIELGKSHEITCNDKILKDIIE